MLKTELTEKDTEKLYCTCDFPDEVCTGCRKQADSCHCIDDVGYLPCTKCDSCGCTVNDESDG